MMTILKLICNAAAYTYKCIGCIMLILLSPDVMAQENTQKQPISSEETPSSSGAITIHDDVYGSTKQPDYILPALPQPADTLFLPQVDGYGIPYIGNPWRMYCWGSWGMWHPWQLHKGLNLSLGASVFSTFGSGNTWSGAGFGQDVSAIYAIPLGKRSTLALGGYFSNMMWAHDNFRNAGLTATFGYQFNERLTGYIYAQKSIVSNIPMPYYLHDISNFGDRIGVAVEYKVSPAFSIGASFDVRRDDHSPYYVMPTRRENSNR